MDSDCGNLRADFLKPRADSLNPGEVRSDPGADRQGVRAGSHNPGPDGLEMARDSWRENGNNPYFTI